MRREVRARQSRGFVPPRPTRLGRWLLRTFGALYLRVARGTAGVQILRPEILHDAFKAFYDGSIRLLILFRHVEVADGPLVMHALSGALDRYDRKHGGRSLPRRPHSHFLYGKDVLNWAGAGARWVFPRLGGIPVANTRLERRAHEAIRDIILTGDYPLALAPEGQVTYQMFHVSELTAGAGTMAHWIERDLLSVAKGGSNGSKKPGILLLPLAIGYHLSKDHCELAERTLERLAASLQAPPPPGATLVDRLLRATDLVLDTVEELYQTAYPVVFREAERYRGEPRSARINFLCDRILRCAELGAVRGTGDSILKRLFAVRFRVYDILYPNGVDLEALSPPLRRWSDYRIHAATTMDRHAQIVDILMYVRPEYITAGQSPHRAAEYALNLLDVIHRVSGGNIDSRHTPRHKRARVLVGDPIDAAAVLRAPGQTPKQAIETLNARVSRSLDRVTARLEGQMVAEQPT